jgi:hypothetical protein
VSWEPDPRYNQNKSQEADFEGFECLVSDMINIDLSRLISRVLGA